MQPACLDSLVDSARPEPEIPQLTESNDSVLPRRKPRNPLVEGGLVAFGGHTAERRRASTSRPRPAGVWSLSEEIAPKGARPPGLGRLPEVAGQHARRLCLPLQGQLPQLRGSLRSAQAADLLDLASGHAPKAPQR